MAAYKKMSFNQYDNADGLIITCFCGSDEKIEVEEAIRMETEHNPDVFSFTVTRRIRRIGYRIKEAWDVLRGRPYPYTDYVLIDRDAAMILIDWMLSRMSYRKEKDVV